jgi:hypothetical protein
MTDVEIEFAGRPLDGVSAACHDDYQAGAEPNARRRWPYEYAGMRSR